MVSLYICVSFDYVKDININFGLKKNLQIVKRKTQHPIRQLYAWYCSKTEVSLLDSIYWWEFKIASMLIWSHIWKLLHNSFSATFEKCSISWKCKMISSWVSGAGLDGLSEILVLPTHYQRTHRFYWFLLIWWKGRVVKKTFKDIFNNFHLRTFFFLQRALGLIREHLEQL